MALDAVILKDEGGHSFAAGLHWKRIVASGGDSAEKDARSYAIKQRSNRMILARGARGEVGAVGCAKISHKEPPVLSLAYALCLQYEPKDKVAAAIRISPDQIWVCAIADGLIVNGFDVVTDEDSAFIKIRTFVERYAAGSVAMLGDALSDATVMTLQDLFEVAISHESECVVTSMSTSKEDRKKIILIVLAVCVVIAANYGWGRYKAYRAAKEAALEELNKAPKMSPQEAWSKAVLEWSKTTKLTTPFALHQVLVAIGSIPLELGGWTAKDVECARLDANWNCSINFMRVVEKRATTQDLLESLPKGWTADWGSMNMAKVKFTAPAQVTSPVVAGFKPAQEMTLPLLALLQRDSRAFASSEIGPAAAVKTPPPLDGDGKPMVIDPSTVKPALLVMSASVTGPLRSMYLLLDAPISWKVIKVDIGKFTGADGDPGRSALNVKEAKGEIYAIK